MSNQEIKPGYKVSYVPENYNKSDKCKHNIPPDAQLQCYEPGDIAIVINTNECGCALVRFTGHQRRIFGGLIANRVISAPVAMFVKTPTQYAQDNLGSLIPNEIIRVGAFYGLDKCANESYGAFIDRIEDVMKYMDCASKSSSFIHIEELRDIKSELLTAKGKWLDNIAYIYGLERKAEEPDSELLNRIFNKKLFLSVGGVDGFQMEGCKAYDSSNLSINIDGVQIKGFITEQELKIEECSEDEDDLHEEEPVSGDDLMKSIRKACGRK